MPTDATDAADAADAGRTVELEAPGFRRTRREVRAIAGLEALDGLRSRRQLVVRALTPVVLFVCVLGITLQLRGADTVTHPDAYKVAVQGDYEGARHSLERLNPGRLVFVPVGDARVAAITNADVGIRVPDHLDQTLDQAQVDATAPAPQVDVYEVTVNPPSRAAAVLVRAGFVDLRQQKVRQNLEEITGNAAAKNGLFSPTQINVEVTVAGTRTITSQLIPGLICLQAALLVTGTANRLVSRRTRGLLMAQLLLPVSRRSLALAKGIGELTIGSVTAVPVVVAIVAFGALTTTHVGTAGDVVINTFATLITMVALFSVTTAVGVIVGTGARTQEQVSLATGGAVIVATLIAATVAIADTPRPAFFNVIPFAGSVSALRDILNNAGSPAAFVVATVSSLIGALLLIALAGRSLDAERMVMRNG